MLTKTQESSKLNQSKVKGAQKFVLIKLLFIKVSILERIERGI